MTGYIRDRSWGDVAPNSTLAWAVASTVGPADPLGKCPHEQPWHCGKTVEMRSSAKHGLTSSRHLWSRGKKRLHV